MDSVVDFYQVQGTVDSSFIGRRGDMDGPVPIKRQQSYICSA
jgi:hypothetical protein